MLAIPGKKSLGIFVFNLKVLDLKPILPVGVFE